MADATTKKSAAQVRRLLSQIPALLAGRQPDPTGVVEQIQIAVGVQVLSLVKEAFLIKAQGGVDACGIQWPPLKPSTIAGRRHPGLKRKKRGERPRGLLTKPQDKLWRGIFASVYRRTGDKGKAGATAWVILKRLGAKTILGMYGNTKCEILKDTNVMFNSLSPGFAGPSGDPNQVFRLEPGRVIIGTLVPYAEKHHRGIPGRLPKRQLWPDSTQEWPESWKQAIADVIANGIRSLIIALLQHG